MDSLDSLENLAMAKIQGLHSIEMAHRIFDDAEAHRIVRGIIDSIQSEKQRTKLLLNYLSLRYVAASVKHLSGEHYFTSPPQEPLNDVQGQTTIPRHEVSGLMFEVSYLLGQNGYDPQFVKEDSFTEGSLWLPVDSSEKKPRRGSLVTDGVPSVDGESSNGGKICDYGSNTGGNCKGKYRHLKVEHATYCVQRVPYRSRCKISAMANPIELLSVFIKKIGPFREGVLQAFCSSPADFLYREGHDPFARGN